MILFICVGNTCRSAMAEAFARKRGLEAESAGIMARPGSPASDKAIRAAALHGVDLTGHRARQVTEEMILKADQAWAMTSAEWDALNMRFPETAAKVDVLYPEIPDPHGRDETAYERCALRLMEAMERAGIFGDK